MREVREVFSVRIARCAMLPSMFSHHFRPRSAEGTLHYDFGAKSLIFDSCNREVPAFKPTSVIDFGAKSLISESCSREVPGFRPISFAVGRYLDLSRFRWAISLQNTDL